MQATIKIAQKSIPQLRSARIEDIFISTMLAEYDDLLVQMTEETWSHVVDRVREIEITLEEPDDSASSGAPAVSGFGDGLTIGPSEANSSSRAHPGMYLAFH
jgi:hypothetical protein